MKRFLVIVAVVVLLVPCGQGVRAADAPPPDLCTLDPRPIENLVALATTPPATPVIEPTAIAEPFVMPEGAEVDAKLRREVKKDIRRAIGCVNTGRLTRILTAYTDYGVQQFFSQPEFQQAIAAVSAAPGGLEQFFALEVPRAEEDWVTIIQFDDMVLLPDGRVAAVVEGDDPTDDEPAGRTLFYLVEVKPGRWLIDEFVKLPAVEGSPVAAG